MNRTILMNRSNLARLATGTLVAGLALSGCGAGSTTAPAADQSAPSSASQTQHNEADVAFAQGMIPHHRQAVEMSAMAVDRSENPEVLDLAQQIGTAQQPEIDTMTTWLGEWGAEVPGPGEMGEMSGMDHSDMDGGGMAGMMTSEQMTQLSEASGAAFDRMFLELMTEHHLGAVEMAEIELTDGSDPRALELAQTIIDTQQAEITEMEQLLQQL